MLELNKQPIEKVLKPGPDAHGYDVVKVWQTIQGEGPFAGHPAVFVRLAGCNLQCPWCDTNYTDGRGGMGIYTLVDKIKQQTNEGKIELVVLTGGEPFRQHIWPLISQLNMEGLNCQIETNGTAFQPGHHALCGKPTVVCSPKVHYLNDELLPFISAYKYVVQAGLVNPDDGLPTSALGNKGAPARPAFWAKGPVPGCHPKYHLPMVPIYVQPLDQGDEKLNRMNMEAAIASCMKFGYTLCLQMHKYAGLQ